MCAVAGEGVPDEGICRRAGSDVLWEHREELLLLVVL